MTRKQQQQQNRKKSEQYVAEYAGLQALLQHLLDTVPCHHTPGIMTRKQQQQQQEEDFETEQSKNDFSELSVHTVESICTINSCKSYAELTSCTITPGQTHRRQIPAINLQKLLRL
jgi:hypothetical protein